jgi:hypothetical protein
MRLDPEGQVAKDLGAKAVPQSYVLESNQVVSLPRASRPCPTCTLLRRGPEEARDA